MNRAGVAAEMKKIISICKWGRARDLDDSFKLAFSPANRTRIRQHLMRRCGIEVSAAKFLAFKTVGDLIEHAVPLLTRRRRAFPEEWHKA